jgi:hypothetical protein
VQLGAFEGPRCGFKGSIFAKILDLRWVQNLGFKIDVPRIQNLGFKIVFSGFRNEGLFD